VPTRIQISSRGLRDPQLRIKSSCCSLRQLTLSGPARCRSPHQILVWGSLYIFSKFGARGLFFEKFNTEIVWGSTTRWQQGSHTLLLQSSAWRNKLVLVLSRPICKYRVAGAGSCPWLPSSSQKASPLQLLCSHISWYDTICFLPPCGCS